MRFRDTRPEPPTGAKYLALPAGRLLAEAFSLGSQEAFTPPRKDPDRTRMALRFQAAVRRGFAAAALEGVKPPRTHARERAVLARAARS